MDEATIWKAKAEALEAENARLREDLLTAEAERDWWQEWGEGQLERAARAEAEVPRAIQTALEMAAQQAHADAGRFDTPDRIRAIRVEDVLARMEGEP